MIAKLKGIDIAFYIFLLTGLGYLVTFLYGWGYNSYFSIPIAFIDLSISNITKSISFLGVFLITAIFYWSLTEEKTDLKFLFEKIFSFKYFSNQKLKVLLQTICVLGVLLFYYLWKQEESSSAIIYLFVGLAFFCGFCYTKRYEKMLLVSWVVLVLSLPYIVGMSTAMRQENFYFVDNQKNYLVIDFYNNKAIAAKFDKRQRKIYPEFKLIPIGSLSNNKNELSLIKVNNLQIERAQTIK